MSDSISPLFSTEWNTAIRLQKIRNKIKILLNGCFLSQAEKRVVRGISRTLTQYAYILINHFSLHGTFESGIVVGRTKRVMYSHSSRSKISFVGTGTWECSSLCQPIEM